MPADPAWSPVERLVANGHRFMYPCVFERTSDGTLRVVGRGLGGPGKWLTGFEWGDSSSHTQWIHRYGGFWFFIGNAGPTVEDSLQ